VLDAPSVRSPGKKLLSRVIFEEEVDCITAETDSTLPNLRAARLTDRYEGALTRPGIERIIELFMKNGLTREQAVELAQADKADPGVIVEI
jgi:hypothetical protein